MNTLMESLPRRHRITVDEYYRMAEVGLLAPDARVELIDGEIIDMAPIGVDHSSVVGHLEDLFHEAVGRHGLVRAQSVVRLDRRSEPQPDIAVLVRRADYYRRAHPTPADVLLLIEVSDSTLRYDRDVKVPLYARHGIPEVWIVDLRNGQLHLHRSAEGGQYRDCSGTDHPGLTPIAALPGVAVDLSGLFAEPVK
ncbi:MAG TPA: Uma2 family endonuclease [Steroidobacteraceae bacterium]|nr:Uma2 family endonuclease [Steroidobacteraceae bacterium]